MLEGKVEHGDSMDNKGVISPGDIQWMTAGSGIIHQEMPKGINGHMWGFQLWVNLPSTHKMMGPRYREVKKEQIPAVATDKNVMVRVICGKFGGISGHVRDIMADPEYLDITMAPHSEFEHRIKKGYKGIRAQNHGSFTGLSSFFHRGIERENAGCCGNCTISGPVVAYASWIKPYSSAQYMDHFVIGDNTCRDHRHDSCRYCCNLQRQGDFTVHLFSYPHTYFPYFLSFSWLAV
jgi:hypothetical protein